MGKLGSIAVDIIETRDYELDLADTKGVFYVWGHHDL
jgi:hypothetical protein